MVVQDIFRQQWEPASTSVTLVYFFFVHLCFTGHHFFAVQRWCPCWERALCWMLELFHLPWVEQLFPWSPMVWAAPFVGAQGCWSISQWTRTVLCGAKLSTRRVKQWILDIPMHKHIPDTDMNASFVTHGMGKINHFRTWNSIVFLWPYFLTHPWIFVPKSTRRGTLVYVRSYIGIQNATLRYLFLSIPTHWWTVTKFLLGRTTIRSSAWDENRRISLARLMDSKRQFHRIADQTTWHKLAKKQSHTAVSQSRETRRGTCFSIIFNCVGCIFWW